MKLTLTLFLLALAFSSLATTFTVTTNADSGPGSLRDAITQAAANGTAAPDMIVFNIADQSRAGRTIILASALPALTSNLTIDGTTQPGVPFGISAARIIITNPFSLQYVNYFVMIGVSNVQIYGLFLEGVSAGYAFYFREASNLTFGAAAKGNIVQGFATAVECDYLSSTDPGSNNITIQGNIMGTDETGTLANYNQFNTNGFYLRNVSNLQIGGLNAGEGNLMNMISTPMDYTDTRNIDFGYLNFQGNKVGTDVTGNTRLSPNYAAVEINGDNNGDGTLIGGTTTLAINITNNISACGYDLFDIASYFFIQGNHIGVGPDNTSNIINDGFNGSQAGIWLTECGHGLIGGSAPGQMNYIANFIQWGVFEAYSGPITVSRNSIFCNGTGIAPGWQYYNLPIPYVNITLLTAGTVGGNATPNSTVELFYDDECPGCEGKTYIGTTTADNNGNWTYSLTATGAIVATATDTHGATSAFSTATINTDKIVVQNATCGRNNGSIKNIQVTSGTEWYWQDAAGNIVANSVDLTNVGPGTYTFVTSIGGASCDASSTPYTIANINPPAFDPNAISVTQPSCGQNNGVLQDNGSFDPGTTYSWLVAGVTVSPDYSLANPFTSLAPGNYTLRLALKQDPTCAAQYGPYNLVNQSGPSLDVTAALTTSSTCGNANGSITGISFQHATNPVYFAWRDNAGQTVSNTADLTNAYAGVYRLAFKDAGGCDTIFTSWYTVADLGSISYDTSAMLIIPASCATANGSITGITSTNAATFTWTNTGTGSVAGAGEELSGVAGGVYRLSMSNAYGCQAQTPGLAIPQVPTPAFDYSRMQVLNDTCNTGIGSILDLAMGDARRTYTWKWYDAANGSAAAPLATTAGYLDSMREGQYAVSVADQYGCTIISNMITIADVDLAPLEPQVTDQYIPRNTSTTIAVGNPQKGMYELLDGPTFGTGILDSSTAGILHTPPIPRDETFYVGFTRGDCSSTLAAVNIKVFDSVRIFVPNAFTPNGDGANDRWHIIVQGLTKKIQVIVFDRWGTQVFNSTDPNFSWDGTAGGHPLSGTFVYMIAGIDYYNKPFLLKGTMMIIR
jgi:gliding motility-associated-like protein